MFVVWSRAWRNNDDMADDNAVPEPVELPCVGETIWYVRFQQGIWIVFEDGEFVRDAKHYARINEIDSIVISVVDDGGGVIRTVTKEGDPEEFLTIMLQLWTTSVTSASIGTDSALRIETLSGVRIEVPPHERFEAYEYNGPTFSIYCRPGGFVGDIHGWMFNRKLD